MQPPDALAMPTLTTYRYSECLEAADDNIDTFAGDDGVARPRKASMKYARRLPTFSMTVSFSHFFSPAGQARDTERSV